MLSVINRSDGRGTQTPSPSTSRSVIMMLHCQTVLRRRSARPLNWIPMGAWFSMLHLNLPSSSGDCAPEACQHSFIAPLVVIEQACSLQFFCFHWVFRLRQSLQTTI